MSILSHFKVRLGFKIGELNLMRFPSLAKRESEFDFEVFLPTIRDKETGKMGINLQRGRVWDLEQKRQLIYSILKEIYLPPISIIDRSYLPDGQKIYQVIDGLQRLTTMIDFAKNSFSIEVEGKEVFYKDFDNDTKVFIDGFFPKFHVGYENQNSPITDLQKYTWCKTVNYGTPMNKKHFDRFEV